MLIFLNQEIINKKGKYVYDFYLANTQNEKNDLGIYVDQKLFKTHVNKFIRASLVRVKHVVLAKSKNDKSIDEVEFKEIVQKNDHLMVIPQRFKNQLEQIDFLEYLND